MDITSWVDWCAVLGFGLSLALAIAELLRRRKRLAVSLAKAVFAGEGDLWCNLFLTITHKHDLSARRKTAIAVGRFPRRGFFSNSAKF